MAMKETVFSIRAYFGLIGAFGLIRGVSGLIVSMEDQIVVLPAAIVKMADGYYQDIDRPDHRHVPCQHTLPYLHHPSKF